MRLAAFALSVLALLLAGCAPRDTFSVTITGRYGHDEAKVEPRFRSRRPEKQSAELAVLEAALRAYGCARREAWARAGVTPLSESLPHAECPK